jgi:hypothetical protein
MRVTASRSSALLDTGCSSQVNVVDRSLAPRIVGLLDALQQCVGPLVPSASRTELPSVNFVETLDRVAAPRDGAHPADVVVVQQVAGTGAGSTNERRVCEIVFADHQLVPWPFRSRRVSCSIVLDRAAMTTVYSEGDSVLAQTGDGSPVWTARESDHGIVFRTALQLPNVSAQGDVWRAIGDEKFLQALPLAHAWRHALGSRLLDQPALRAGFIIDDPNLHWPTYGFANYREVARSASSDHYHVGFATIPLDGWWVHPAAADVFRDHAGSVSLLVHGNNHGHQELADRYTPEQAAGLLHQAIARIERLEAKARVNVSRVMVPPHGACASSLMQLMPGAGFEAACISAGSLRAHNAGQDWTHRLGLSPIELVEGCPVMPRWAFDGASDATLLISAFLGQALILRGHHQDLRDGLDLFRDAARRINALGTVRWGKLADLARWSFRSRRNGSVQWVQPLGLTHDVAADEGIAEIRLIGASTAWQAQGNEHHGASSSAAAPLDPQYGWPTYRLSLERPRPPSRQGLEPPTPSRLVVRRLLTELRDRLKVN